MQVKQQKNAQTRTRAQRLRQDIRAGPPQTDSHERENTQQSQLLQRKGMRVRGQALQHEYATVPGDAGPFPPSQRKFDLVGFLVYAPPAPMIRLFYAANIVYFYNRSLQKNS